MIIIIISIIIIITITIITIKMMIIIIIEWSWPCTHLMHDGSIASFMTMVLHSQKCHDGRFALMKPILMALLRF